jgi:hypothetical protein
VARNPNEAPATPAELEDAIIEAVAEQLAAFRTTIRAELQAEMLAERQNTAQRVDRISEYTTGLGQLAERASAEVNGRMDALERSFTATVEQYDSVVTARVAELDAASRAFTVDQVTAVIRRIDDIDNRSVERLLALENRVTDFSGTRLAEMEATLGRVTRSMDQVVNVLAQRLDEIDLQQRDVLARIDRLAEEVGAIDADALDALRDQMSSAVGESMLVRIELDRATEATNKQIDRLNVRIGDLATQVAETTMDVSAAVQLERLEEIERALIELDPAQFVRAPGYTGPSPSRYEPTAVHAPTPTSPTTDTPVTDIPVTDTPVTETPITDTRVTETPFIATPFIATPVTEAPFAEPPFGDDDPLPRLQSRPDAHRNGSTSTLSSW